MNNFFNSIINTLRGIRTSVMTNLGFTSRSYTFGTIISGTYRNFKHDPNPSVLCLGTYQVQTKKGLHSLTHGINIHYLNPQEQQWLIKNLYMIKRGNQIVNPRFFYQFLKMNAPSIIKKAYRIYYTNLLDCKVISVGCSSLPNTFGYVHNITDSRDMAINELNQAINAIGGYTSSQNTAGRIVEVSYSQDELNQHIIESLNSHKVFA